MANTLIRNNKIIPGVAIGYLLVLGIAYFTMIDKPSVVSDLITLTFPLVLIVFLHLYQRHIVPSYYTGLVITLSILVFLNISIWLVINDGAGGFNYYKKAIMFLTTVIWFIYCSFTKISRPTLYYILFINLLLVSLYHLFFKEIFEEIEGESFVTLNFSNPNLTGMFILNSLLYVGISIVCVREITHKIIYQIIWLGINITLFIGSFSILLLTGNRSSLMALIFWAGLVILDWVSVHNFKPKKWIIAILVAFPFLFLFIYTSFAHSLGETVSFGMEIRGKTNTSRNHVWMPIINEFYHYFLIGDYYKISNGTGVSQLHNTHLDIFASYGIIPLILYIVFLYKISVKAWFNSHSKIQRTALYAFLSLLVSCTFEAGLVAGSAGLFILSGGFLLLCNYRSTSLV